MEESGFVEGTEVYGVCSQAIRYLGCSYERSEELSTSNTIDCSTLTSQSFWEGALIGIPFVAETQRKAFSGSNISTENLQPGDVLIKYSSVEASPDKRWNHVGLSLGRDPQAIDWLIESVGSIGVRLATVDDFNPEGGIKRFVLSSFSFDNDRACAALRLAPQVPKFGRLGVRQYQKFNNCRLAHQGVDIYTFPGRAVFATQEGVVRYVFNEIERSFGVEILGPEIITRYYQVQPMVSVGKRVCLGEQIAIVVPPSKQSQVVYSGVDGSDVHLHLEAEFLGAEHKKCQFPTLIRLEKKSWANHLYLSKIGELGLPF